MILFLAGLQAVPVVYQKRSSFDGANAQQRPAPCDSAAHAPDHRPGGGALIINGFRTFALRVMTGGFAWARLPEIVPLLIYKTAFAFLRMGEASAMSVVYFLLILVFWPHLLRVAGGNDEQKACGRHRHIRCCFWPTLLT
ncbi:MAG: hypothetical protein M9927_03895 [Anaerolineae bacterium]|nr:hypothetical protein [Anaerolineae bacterium]